MEGSNAFFLGVFRIAFIGLVLILSVTPKVDLSLKMPTELSEQPRILYNQILDYLECTPQGMPTIIIGKEVWVGFQESYQQEIKNELNACLANGCLNILSEVEAKVGRIGRENEIPESSPALVKIPILGEVSLQSTFLLLSTLIIGFVDGFNPCSLWMLTVLLSLSLYMQSRPKTLLLVSHSSSFPPSSMGFLSPGFSPLFYILTSIFSSNYL